MTEHDRKRVLAKELISARLRIEADDVAVIREQPTRFGHRTELYCEVDGEQVPLVIRNTSFRAATVVAVADPDIAFGLDLRDAHPDEPTLREMRRHSHLFDENDVPSLLEHWTRVVAIREADGRKNLIRGDNVRLNSTRTKGWVPDRKTQYELVDLSRDGWIITLAWAKRDD
ncbi:hypothetical protein [Microbacterium immunditiarum]|uniref:Uncharacterized protein n=1 Tax=Microbacterium immunditiarum TaxID=337480 RepID=A0A7Y9KIZ0_9MICO|nr:hypothetical protein [Microbacterium immunditiarum]NYE19116.1 hypothetical protein [Microbacterium immunditiarum]